MTCFVHTASPSDGSLITGCFDFHLGKPSNVENVMYGASVCPAGGSDSPISWKKYPFLDIPEGGASAEESRNRGRQQSLRWNWAAATGPAGSHFHLGIRLFVVIFTHKLSGWEMITNSDWSHYQTSAEDASISVQNISRIQEVTHEFIHSLAHD